MNQKVENLIKQKKELLDVSRKQIRDKHLISIGLIDEEKTRRVYLDFCSETAKYDAEKQMYYGEVADALEVTDEEYAEVCKYFPPSPPTECEISKTGAEVTLNAIAIIVLVCGIIGTLICLFTIVFVDSGNRYADEVFSPTGLVITLGVLLSSLTTWAVLKLFCEVAANIREIKNKTK